VNRAPRRAGLGPHGLRSFCLFRRSYRVALSGQNCSACPLLTSAITHVFRREASHPEQPNVCHSRRSKRGRRQKLLDQHETADSRRPAAGLSGKNSSSATTSPSVSYCARSICAKWTPISSVVNMRLTSETNRGSSLANSGWSGGSSGKGHQFLADKIIEGGRDPVSLLDGASCLALLRPNVM
jgi:hypothetical protein